VFSLHGLACWSKLGPGGCLPDKLATLSVPLPARLSLASRCPLFRGLAPEALESLVKESSLREARRRQRLFEQGDPAPWVWVLTAGLVKVTNTTDRGDEVILRLTGPGEVLAGVGLGAGASHLVSAVALEPSQVLVWSRPLLEAALEHHPTLARNALRIMRERLRELEEDHALLATRKLEQRLALLLVRLAGRYGRPCDEGTSLGLTREELGQMVGTDVFGVSRLLASWESQGLVLSRREVVVIRAPERLAAVGEGWTRESARPAV